MRVPFGRRSVIGLVVDLPEESDLPAEQLKAIEEILPAPVLPADWFRLTGFCASYYQAPLGEVMLIGPAAGLRGSTRRRRARRRRRKAAARRRTRMTDEQAAAIDAVRAIGGERAQARACCSASPAAARPRSICA